jgi:D-beta-D-heptose 7-phosphate kinase/D-beta-D-heptose 1-phosphate adenosyltransferase
VGNRRSERGGVDVDAAIENERSRAMVSTREYAGASAGRGEPGAPRRFRPVADKIRMDRAAFGAELEALRAAAPAEAKPRVVFTNGCFDLLHPGHISYLTEAAGLGTHLVVALNSDESIRRLKGESRPILPLVERLKVIASLACVDFATWFDEPDPRPLINVLRPELLVKGGDYAIDQILGRDEVWSWGGDVKALPVLAGYSTTSYLKKMQG